jgi:Domain of unknown function (DUF1844)
MTKKEEKEEQDASFRVIDRRLFTTEGDLREDAAAERHREEKAAPVKPAQKEAAAPAGAPSEKPKAIPAFAALVELVARNALALLGGVADPRTGQPFLDLEGARELIDVLDALREKTRGNLAPEEEQMLLDVIGSLKMSFLEMSRAAAGAASRREKSTGKA